MPADHRDNTEARTQLAQLEQHTYTKLGILWELRRDAIKTCVDEARVILANSQHSERRQQRMLFDFVTRLLRQSANQIERKESDLVNVILSSRTIPEDEPLQFTDSRIRQRAERDFSLR